LFDDVGSNTTVGDEFGLFVDGVRVGLILPITSDVGASVTNLLVGDDCVGLALLPIISDVGASVTTLSVGDDCTGLPLEGVGSDAPVGDKFGLLVDAVGCTPGVGGPVINWSVGN